MRRIAENKFEDPPGGFWGAPRAIKQNYHETMIICGKYGKPAFFNVYLQSQVEGNCCQYYKLLDGF
jgi:hypothetical protein